MTFVQPEFVWLMTIVFGVYWLMPAAPWRRVAQNVVLLVASCVFYGWVHPWFLILLFASATVDYFAAIFIERYPHQRTQLLAVSMATNLGMLGYFKYYNFFVENVMLAAEAIGVPFRLETLSIILPVGISFYTFQTMSYTIDVYRGKLKACTSYLDYAVYVTFFPQLVAGPIERAVDLLPQMQRERSWSTPSVLSGFGLFLWGAFKKVCVADVLAPYVDEVFMLRDPAFPMVVAAGFAFGVQMLADFSGYSDMARGAGRMLGFELSVNFDRPYSAHSTPEFWRRWHISLSSWVGDYVYTPLLRTGKPSAARTLAALFTTFLIIGLWHGASWNYISIGVWNGWWMAAYTFGTPMLPRWMRENYWLNGFAWMFHTGFVLQVTGLMFRETSMTRVFQHLAAVARPTSEDEWAAAGLVFSMAFLGTLPTNVSYWVEDSLFPWLTRKGWAWPAQTSWWAVEALAIYVMFRDNSQDFIYFQF
jgi:D-alanyl-lipoteichoic acid acyltransferase DltB (MBOAT superfamily)